MRVHWLFIPLILVGMASGRPEQVLILLGSLAAHEVAHLAVAWVLGLQVDDLVLTPLGGCARMETALEADPQSETSVALAGPFQSFFLAGLALFMSGSELWDQELVRFFFNINANLAFFNLIPALPLDGGRALRGLLAQRWGYRRVTRWMTWSGRVIGVLMAVGGVLLFRVEGQLYGAPLAGGLFLAHLAGREEDQVNYRTYGQFLRKRNQLAQRRIAPTRQLMVIEGTRLREVLEQLSPRRYHLIVVVDARLQPVGTLNEAELMDAFAELGPETTVERMLER